MTTIFFPSTWLYRHCAQWCNDRELPFSYAREMEKTTGKYPNFFWTIAKDPQGGYYATFDFLNPPQPRPMDLANAFINERFNK